MHVFVAGATGFIGPTLRKIFQYRGDVIRLRFGVVPA